MKILSIVIPTYNVEKYLERCIESLVYYKEILEKLEIIIVNDGSKDNSLKIAKDLEKEYSNCIKVIDKENGGHGSTINAALKIATGKYFRVIDSDDWVNIDEFYKYVQDIEKLDVDLIITDYTKEFIYKGTTKKIEYSDDIEKNKIYDLNTFDLKKLGTNYFYMATSTIKTKILQDANITLDEKTFYVDMEYILLPIPYINKFIRLDYDIYRYFIGRPVQSISINSFVKNRKNHEKVLKRLLNFYKNTKMSNNKKQYIENILIQMFNTHYVIYCKAILPKKSDIKEIREFDKYVKDNFSNIYERSNKEINFIKWNRKTNFIFAQGYRNLFSRLIDKYFKGGEK